MSGRLNSQIKAAGDFSVNYTVPAGKFVAGSVLLTSRDPDPIDNDVTIIVQNPNIDSTGVVDDGSRVQFDINGYQQGSGGTDKLLISNGLAYEWLGAASDYIGTKAVTQDGTTYLTPSDFGHPSGRFVPAHHALDSAQENFVFFWDGNNTIYYVAAFSPTPTLSPFGVTVADLGTTVTDDTVPITITTDRNNPDELVIFYGPGKRAYVASAQWNTATQAAVLCTPDVGTDRFQGNNEIAFNYADGNVRPGQLYLNAAGIPTMIRWNNDIETQVPDVTSIMSTIGPVENMWLTILNEDNDNQVFVWFSKANGELKGIALDHVKSGVDDKSFTITGLELNSNEEVIQILTTDPQKLSPSTFYVVTNQNLYSMVLYPQSIGDGDTTAADFTRVKGIVTAVGAPLNNEVLYGSLDRYYAITLLVNEDEELFNSVTTQNSFPGYYQSVIEGWYYENTSMSQINNATVYKQESFDNTHEIKGLLFGADDAITVVGSKDLEVSILGIEQPVVL